METKRITQSSLQKLVVIIMILVLSHQAFCSDPNSTNTTGKIQVHKQPEKMTLTVKTKPSVSPSSFRPDMSFREAVEILRNCTSPPLNIVVLWKDLDENTDITPDTPIEMNGLRGVPLKTHLSVLLMSLSTEAAQLGYVVDGNVIIIGLKESLPKKIATRVYDVGDIVAPPSMGGMMGGYGNMMGGYGNMMGGYGNMMGGYGNMMGGYGNMSQYGTYGNQYGTGYNQGYMNQGYMNQGFMNQGIYGNRNRPPLM